MSDAEQDNRSDQRSRWNMIASLLGAAVPKEPEQPSASEVQAEDTAQPPASAAPTDEAAATPPSKPKRARPQRRPSGWNDLCGELGIATPTVPAGSEDIPPASTSPPATDPPAAADEAATVPGRDRDVDREPSLTFFDPDAALEEDMVDVELGAAEPAQPEADDAEEAVADARTSEGDTPVESTGRGKRRRRRRRRSEPAEREEGAADDAPSLAGDETIDESDRDGSLAGDEATDREEAGESDRPERGRRSRRRRRRPTRREEVPADGDVVSPVAGDDADETDTDVDEIDDVDDVDDVDEDEEPIREGRAGRSSRSDGSSRGKHKKIPTWEEAISVIVAVNLETRRRDGNDKNRPRGGARRRGRGSNDRN